MKPRTYEQFHPRGLEQADLRACGACGALVAGEDRERHSEWHRVLVKVVLGPPFPEDDA